MAQATIDELRRLAVADPAAFEPELAGALERRSLELFDARRLEEARAAAAEAVAIYRQLAAADPAVDEALVRALVALGIYLTGLGDHDQALLVNEQVVMVYRRLVAADPAEHEVGLADALFRLAKQLADLDRYHEALELTEQALAQYSRLAAASPDRFEPNRVDAEEQRRRLVGLVRGGPERGSHEPTGDDAAPRLG
jgi:tetratricopeptide (TPR) repeat protein